MVSHAGVLFGFQSGVERPQWRARTLNHSWWYEAVVVSRLARKAAISILSFLPSASPAFLAASCMAPCRYGSDV